MTSTRHRQPIRTRRQAPATPDASTPRRLTLVAATELLVTTRSDWSKLTKEDARNNLTGGRFRDYCAEQEIVYLDQLTTAHVAEFLALQADLGMAATSLRRRRTMFRSLATFQSQFGYGDSLQDIDQVRAAKPPGRRDAPVLDPDQETVLIRSCKTVRDRLIIETFLATGVRVSELCALTIDDLVMAKPPYLLVSKSVHHDQRTKHGDARKTPFRIPTLPRRLEQYIAEERPKAIRRQLFLSDKNHQAALGTQGIEKLCQRLGVLTGIVCNPHKLRHTWATRCADAGIPIFNLQQAGGWKSIEMVRHYYSASDRAALEAFARHFS